MNGYWRKSREMTEEEETMLQLRTERCCSVWAFR